jgi:hypothetical protein
MPIPFPGAFLHRSLFRDGGTFDESFQVSGDYEFALRSLLKGSALFLDDLLVTLMTEGGKSSSRESRLAKCMEDARARRLHGLFPYPAFWCWETVKVCLYHIVEAGLGKRTALLVEKAWRRLP